MNKVIKYELTDKQYKDIKSSVVQETAEHIAKIKLNKFIEKFIIAMRRNRISQKRINKIVNEFNEGVNRC